MRNFKKELEDACSGQADLISEENRIREALIDEIFFLINKIYRNLIMAASRLDVDGQRNEANKQRAHIFFVLFRKFSKRHVWLGEYEDYESPAGWLSGELRRDNGTKRTVIANTVCEDLRYKSECLDNVQRINLELERKARRVLLRRLFRAGS